MAIDVIFDKNGFYHPAFGRLGRGDKNRGTVYTLPDAFAEEGKLPKTARILRQDEVEDALEENDQRKPVKPKVLDEVQYKKALDRAQPDSARKRTTGSDKKPLE